MKCISIPQDMTKPLALVDIREERIKPIYQYMADHIGNGCKYVTQTHSTLFSQFGVVLVVDEEGLSHDKAKLNHRASLVHPNELMCGNALLVMLTDDREEWCDLSKMRAQNILRHMQQLILTLPEGVQR